MILTIYISKCTFTESTTATATATNQVDEILKFKQLLYVNLLFCKWMELAQNAKNDMAENSHINLLTS